MWLEVRGTLRYFDSFIVSLFHGIDTVYRTLEFAVHLYYTATDRSGLIITRKSSPPGQTQQGAAKTKDFSCPTHPISYPISRSPSARLTYPFAFSPLDTFPTRKPLLLPSSPLHLVLSPHLLHLRRGTRRGPNNAGTIVNTTWIRSPATGADLP